MIALIAPSMMKGWEKGDRTIKINESLDKRKSQHVIRNIKAKSVKKTIQSFKCRLFYFPNVSEGGGGRSAGEIVTLIGGY